MRLFFALMPDVAERELAATASRALGLGPEARLVPCGNYHITLAFIGEVAAQQLPIVLAIGAAQRAVASSLRFETYDYWLRAEVVVAAARLIPAELQRLSLHLHGQLAPHGWALEVRPWRPHITLAKKVAQAPVLPAMSAFEWRPREFCLMRSDTSDRQSAYTVVATWPLLDKPEKQ